MKTALFFLAFFLAVACGCGGTSSGGNDDGAVDEGDVGYFTLTIDFTVNLSQIDGAKPATGNHFVAASIALRNVSVMTPLRLDPAHFSASTASSLVYSAVEESAQLVPACSRDVAVAAGGVGLCQVAFEAPIYETLTRIAYDDEEGHRTIATIPTPPDAGAEPPPDGDVIDGIVVD